MRWVSAGEQKAGKDARISGELEVEREMGDRGGLGAAVPAVEFSPLHSSETFSANQYKITRIRSLFLLRYVTCQSRQLLTLQESAL